MEFNLTKFLPANWLQAFGSTLFHSLWLGIVLSFVVAIIMFSTRRTSAVIRYNLLTGSLCLFILSILFVFLKAINSESTLLLNQALPGKLSHSETLAYSTSALQNSSVSNLSYIMQIWGVYAPQIVLYWFIIICIKSIQLIVGLQGVYHLKNAKIYAAGKKWDAVLANLSNRLQINQGVKVMQSGLAQVPMVIGHFKPLILIPLGLLNGLNDAEVEAILCHELAHIKRRDYLVNLLQSFIEIVFFFNPAVLWVSKLIRNERENCCDDLAISKVDDRRNYVKALITCQEFQLSAPRFAMAATGNKNHLFQRISRMLFDTKTTLNKMEKTILSIALLSIVIGSAAFTNADQHQSAKQFNPDIANLATKTMVQDSLKNKISKAKKQNAAAKRDFAISKEDSIQAVIDAKQAVEDSKQAVADSKQAIEDSKQAIEDAKRGGEDAKIALEDARQAKEDRKQAIADARQAKADAKRAIADASRAKSYAGQNLYAQTDFTAPKAPNQPPVAPQGPSTPAIPAIPNTPPNLDGKAGKKTESISSINTDKHNYTAIVKSLFEDGLINNRERVSYQLDKNSLIVNGVKQSESMHQRYKNMYMEKNNVLLKYKLDTGSSSVVTQQ